MKRVIITLLCALPFFTFAQSQEGMFPSTVQVVPSNQQSMYYVVYDAEGADKIHLNLYDQQERIIHSQVIKREGGFMQPFNLKALPSGVYTFELANADQVYRKQIHYDPSNDISTAFRASEAKKVNLAINSRILDPISVSIYDDESHLLYQSEWASSVGSTDRIYNFENVESEYVTFVVATPNGVVSEERVSLEK